MVTAKEVLSAARAVPPGGWFGQHRVYINQVFRSWKTQNPTKALDLDTFKKELVRLKRQRAITLGRADMPYLLDEDNCDASRIAEGEESFVFVKLD